MRQAGMDVPEVKPVQLTDEEATLRQQMEDDFAKNRHYSGQYAHRLLKSLSKRNAIPQVRIDTLTKPYPGGRGKSHLDVFKRNSRSGSPIAELPTFVECLRCLIDGPALPVSAIEGFRKIMIDDAGTDGEVMEQLKKFVRSETRKLRLSRDSAKGEFWKLAKEVGYSQAEIIRDATGSAGRT
jgi:hypothetical protein